MKIPVIGLGAGGHAKVLIEALRESVEFEVACLLDPNPQLHGKQVLGIPVLGGDERVEELLASGLKHFFVAAGSVGDCSARKRIYEKGVSFGLQPVKVLHPGSIISRSATIDSGSCVLAGAIINASTAVRTNVIINTGAIVEHDCTIGEHAHVAPGACIAGGVHVGSATHIGIGAVVRQGLNIGKNVVVGAGAVVVADVADGLTVVGVPARLMREKQT